MKVIDFFLTIIILFFVWPLLILIAVLIELTSRGPVIFSQKRIGKNGKVFTMYKFRTMYVGADRDQEKYRYLNEVGHPVFKIKNDPRFVGIGKFLAHTGLDELPQLFNVLAGDMSLVGPRPLPVEERKRLPVWQREREKVLPGITSAWVVNGRHELAFKEWMKSDLAYVQNHNFFVDCQILGNTFFMIIKLLYQKSLISNY